MAKRVQMDAAEASLIAYALQQQAKKEAKDGFQASAEKTANLAEKYWKISRGE